MRQATRVMVATHALENDLRERGFANIVRWTRGVDTKLFRPAPERVRNTGDPVFIYVGRVSVERTSRNFSSLIFPAPRSSSVRWARTEATGGGLPNVRFTGMLEGEALASAYRSADVFVFPSKTDTFGLVLLEAMASGLPVAAFPVMGPAMLLAHRLRCAQRGFAAGRA